MKLRDCLPLGEAPANGSDRCPVDQGIMTPSRASRAAIPWRLSDHFIATRKDGNASLIWEVRRPVDCASVRITALGKLVLHCDSRISAKASVVPHRDHGLVGAASSIASVPSTPL
jgi:hypothetical protein